MRRSGAHLHPRRELRRLCVARRRYDDAGALRLRGQHERCFKSAAISSESEGAEKYRTQRIGSIFKDKDRFTAVSPLHKISGATPPIMLIQSVDDTMAPPGQGILMRKALEAAKRPVANVVLKGEDHWLSNEATRIEMLERSLAFISAPIIGAKRRASPPP